MRVGRRRERDLGLPKGVRPIGMRLFWQPPTARERKERREKNLPASVPLGAIVRVRGRIELTREQRRKWSEVSGYDDAQEAAGTMGELFAIWRRDGLPRTPKGKVRPKSTVKVYGSALKALERQFGACRYGKTDNDASRGEAIGPADVQAWVSAGGRPMENTALAVLSNVFEHAIRIGKTTYNPCLSVVGNDQDARTREPAEWEVECLRTMADQLMGLLMDFEAATGWRVMSIVTMQRAQRTADGILATMKGGKRILLEWTPETRRIMAEADALPGGTAFPASPVFPTARRRAYSYSGFYGAWKALIARTNTELAGCEIQLRIDDLHFHDLRSKAHDDAEDAGREGHELLANTERVADRHYARRARRVRPLR